MPKICFEIEVDTDTGEVMAGISPPEEEETEKAHLQPVADIEEAIGMAREALGTTEPSEGEDEAMMRGYKAAARPRRMMRGEV